MAGRSRGVKAGRRMGDRLSLPFDNGGHVAARLKCHRLCKVEMTPGRLDGLIIIRRQLLPESRATGGPLSAHPVPPDCSVVAGVVDRRAYGSADTMPVAPARTPVPRRAACSRRSRRAPPSGSCRTPGTAALQQNRSGRQSGGRPAEGDFPAWGRGNQAAERSVVRRAALTSRLMVDLPTW
jgi:hypothetical protein